MPPTIITDIPTIRRRAAEILSAPGAWTQGSFRRAKEDGSYCYCLIGACREAAGYYAAAADADDAAAARAAAYYAARAALTAAADAAYYAYAAAYDAAAWNDRPGRTVQEVIGALLKGV